METSPFASGRLSISVLTDTPVYTMLSRQDPNYGAVLCQILKCSGRRELEELGTGRFEVDGFTFLLTKYCSQGPSWRFTIRAAHIEELTHYELSSLFAESLLVLNCGNSDFCALRYEEWSAVLDTENPPPQQTITLRRPKNCGFSVSGSGGELERKIPVQRFHKLFAG